MTGSLAVLLRCWGHEAREAADGREALAVAAEFHPDVVLLDIGLPGEDGCQVARQLREKVGLRHAFLATLTGYSRPEDGLRSREAGCDQHWIKPLDPEVLEKTLASRMKARPEVAPAAERPSPVADRVEKQLRSNPYLALKNVSCECRDGVLTLRGCLPTYYLKQMAQAAAAGVEGVGRIENRIEVVSRA
jgi:CheY-like chemotaxis protein